MNSNSEMGSLTSSEPTSNNVVRFPVEQTRLPGESRETHGHRLAAYDAYDKLAGPHGKTKMEAIIEEIACVLDEFEEQESDDGM